MPPLAVAWDVDGTLVDSEPVHLAALIAVSARYGIDLSHDREDRFLGMHLGAVWAAMSPHYPSSLTMDDWVAQILAEYNVHVRDIIVIPQMLDALHRLHELGVPQVCVSNSERPIVDINIRMLGIENLLRFSISRDDVNAGKPDPEPYREACRRLGFEPHNVLAVEDSETGLLSATAAGLQAVKISLENADDFAHAILHRFAVA